MGLAALLNECFTLDERKQLIKALVKSALRAPLIDMEAAKLLLAYTFGKPKEQVQIEGDITATIVRLPVKQARDEWQQQQNNE